MAAKQAAAKATATKVSREQAAKKSPASAQTAFTKPLATKAAVASPAKPVAVATFTLKQLAAEIAEREQIATREAQTILTGLVGLLVEHLKSGDRLRIGGLGILEVQERPERTGRNPATGEPITIKASKTISFRPAKGLKEAIMPPVPVATVGSHASPESARILPDRTAGSGCCGLPTAAPIGKAAMTGADRRAQTCEPADSGLRLSATLVQCFQNPLINQSTLSCILSGMSPG